MYSIIAFQVFTNKQNILLSFDYRNFAMPIELSGRLYFSKLVKINVDIKNDPLI